MKKRLTAFMIVLMMMLISMNISVSALGVYDSSRANETYYTKLVETLSSGEYKSSSNTYLKDEAGIFTENNNLNAAYAEIVNAAEKTGFNIGVFIGGEYRNDKNTEDFVAEAAEFVFGKGADTNTVFLYLDFEGKGTAYDFIDTFNDTYFYYPDENATYLGFISEMIGESRIDLILDDMYEYLPSSSSHVNQERIVSAIRAFGRGLIEHKENGVASGLFYKNAATGMFRWTLFGHVMETPIIYRHPVLFTILAIIVAVLVGWLFDSVIRKRYKFRESTSVSVYSSSRGVQFNVHRDDFIRKHTTKQKIESSGGSGGSGGGSHSHGSSHRSSSHHGGGRHR